MKEKFWTCLVLLSVLLSVVVVMLTLMPTHFSEGNRRLSGTHVVVSTVRRDTAATSIPTLPPISPLPQRTVSYHLNQMRLFKLVLQTATDAEVLDKYWVAHWISRIGLYSEGERPSPRDPTRHLYGDDKVYQLDLGSDRVYGMWQIPLQLAEYVTFVVQTLQFSVPRMLEIGTCRGATTTFLAIYFSRFGLQVLETVNVEDEVTPQVKALWVELGLPIHSVLFTFNATHPTAVPLLYHKLHEVTFIDGHHDYPYVRRDFETYWNRSIVVSFHDINDIFCVDVRRLWSELKGRQSSFRFRNVKEFTFHSHQDQLMGIGALVTSQSFSFSLSDRISNVALPTFDDHRANK